MKQQRLVRWTMSLLLAVSAVITVSIQPNHATQARASGNWTGSEDPHNGNVPWWTFTDIPLSPRMSAHVNVANGNLLINAAINRLPGVNGFDETMSLRYNSFADGTQGSVGYGWGMNMSRDVGLDVSNPNAPVFVDSTGHAFNFTASGNTYISPPGIDAQLTQVTCRGICQAAYALTYNATGLQDLFNSSGFLISMANRQGNPIGSAYDGSNQPQTLTNTEGQQTTFSASGGVLQSISAPGYNTRSFSYDGSGNLSSTYVPLGQQTPTASFGYDSSHKLTQITDEDGNVTLVSYASGGSSSAVASITRVTNKNNNTGPTWSFSYASGTTTVTDPNSHNTVYGSDGAGRVTSVQNAESHTTQQSWTSDNHLHQVIKPSGATTTYSYDSLNNLTQIQFPDGATISRSYIDPNHPYESTSVTDAEGNTTNYAYNVQGLLGTVTDALGHQTIYAYNSGANTLASFKDPNGHQTGYGYNAQNLLGGTTYPSPLGSESYSYTSADLPYTKTDGKSQQTTFSYDGLVRPVLLKSAAWRVEEGAEEQPMS